LDCTGRNRWRRWIDTALDSLQDILECEKAEIACREGIDFDRLFYDLASDR